MHDFIIVALGWAFAGFINGVAGFGAAMVAMPLVAPFMGMTVAVPSCTLLVLGLNLLMGWNYRRSVPVARLPYLFLGALPGAALGVTALRNLPEEWLKAGMASFILIYSLWGLFSSASQVRLSRVWGVPAGFLSSLFGTAFGFNGPPLVVYTSLSGLPKDAVKGLLGACFIVTSLLIVGAQAAAGLQTRQSLLLFAAAMPAVLLGGKLGIIYSKRVNEKTFRKIVLWMLVLMSLSVFRSILPAL